PPTRADRMVQTMMHVGLDIIRHTSGADETAKILCRIMLHGLASRPLPDDRLDHNSAFAAADAPPTNGSTTAPPPPRGTQTTRGQTKSLERQRKGRRTPAGGREPNS